MLCNRKFEHYWMKPIFQKYDLWRLIEWLQSRGAWNWRITRSGITGYDDFRHEWNSTYTGEKHWSCLRVKGFRSQNIHYLIDMQSDESEWVWDAWSGLLDMCCKVCVTHVTAIPRKLATLMFNFIPKCTLFIISVSSPVCYNSHDNGNWISALPILSMLKTFHCLSEGRELIADCFERN